MGVPHPQNESFPAQRIKALVSVPARVTPPTKDSSKPVRSLHLNESPYPPSSAAIRAMQLASEATNRYPDHNGTDLVDVIAERNDVASDRIVIGAGSNEILFSSAAIALDPSDEVVAPVPGFPAYAKSTALAGGLFVGVPVRADGLVDVPAMLKAVTGRTRVVFVSSPHNPTGGLLPKKEIERLVKELPDHLLLHFDEAYYEFGLAAGGPETLPILAGRTGPWIASRSFSKAYGLAGARVGYGIASSAEVADAYRRARINFTVGAVALAGALAAIRDPAHTHATIDKIAAERDWLAARLQELGFVSLPSAANFLTVLTPLSASVVENKLATENIYVIGMPWRDTHGAIRITVGTREDSEAVIASLKSLVNK
ncbi:aminotransferase class I/II-fold pyridoxal phosphate-dependent enzyme [Ensifer sp. MPMI2T]|nr:aminotransferase class I/II-fold pyridoxal phosphate-dependent enzyme [Ensifer sp. MPMI2T]